MNPSGNKSIYIKGFFASLALFLALLATAIAITSLLTGHLPTDIYIDPIRQFGFYKILWATSPTETLRILLVDNALLIIEHKEPVNESQTWGIYAYALNLLLIGAVVTWFGIGWATGRFIKLNRPLGLFSLGALLVIFANSYLYLASCCSSGPGWILDVWLLSRVFDPLASPWWLELYQSIENGFIYLQIFLATAGLVLMYRGWRLAGTNNQVIKIQ